MGRLVSGEGISQTIQTRTGNPGKKDHGFESIDCQGVLWSFRMPVRDDSVPWHGLAGLNFPPKRFKGLGGLYVKESAEYAIFSR